MTTDREQEAVDEMAQTRVSRPLAWAIAVAFVAGLCVPSLVHGVLAPASLLAAAEALVSRPIAALPDGVFAASRVAQAEVANFETELRNGSPLAQQLRPLTQSALYVGLRAGNTQVQPGRDGTLYFRPSIRHILGPPFLSGAARAARVRAAKPWEAPPSADPRPAIRRFQEDLLHRGIELLVLPIPAKPSVDGAGLGFPAELENPSWEPFLEDLQRRGVGGVDPLAVLRVLPEPRYLATDTHWRPEAMDAVAAATADALAARGVERGRARRRTRSETRENTGDLAQLLGVRSGVVAPDVVEAQVPARPRRDAAPEVLLLGDSFSGIYADETLGFGEGAGFAAALSHHLARPVASLVIHDGGASQTRQALADRPELLDGIDVVVWQFAARELSFGDWKVIPLERGEASLDPRWLHLPAGAPAAPLRGRVTHVAATADPRSAAYPDQVVAVRVAVDTDGVDGSVAWVYAWGMLDRELAPAASLSAGDAVSWRVRPWSDAPEAAHSASRSELSDRPTAAPLLWLEGVEPP